MLLSFLAVCFLGAFDDKREIPAEFIPDGVTRRVGGYRPIRSQLGEDASSVKVAPDGLTNPQYGFIEWDNAKWAYILDEPEEGNAKLYVDSNADGDLTNDPEATWTGRKAGEFTMYDGSAKIDLGQDRIGQINLYRFDPKDPSRAQLKNTLLYYADFGSEYTLQLDDQEFKTFVAGALDSRVSLWLDRNQDGKPSRNYETVSNETPFNFTGTTYVVSVEDGKLYLSKATEELPVLPAPPDLRLGKKALDFNAKTIDGSEIDFPKSFPGKVVMLDFWATWCGPCIGEIPHMKEAYADWHDKGFEILGINFDSANMDEKLAEFLSENELPWPQVYEGKGWETTIGKQHDVSGIPFVLLVDGDTGEILGTSRELRGPGLSEFIGKALERKGQPN
jgi:thiol-disulfide isomerase/thioredoxin